MTRGNPGEEEEEEEEPEDSDTDDIDHSGEVYTVKENEENGVGSDRCDRTLSVVFQPRRRAKRPKPSETS